MVETPNGWKEQIKLLLLGGAVGSPPATMGKNKVLIVLTSGKDVQDVVSGAMALDQAVENIKEDVKDAIREPDTTVNKQFTDEVCQS